MAMTQLAMRGPRNLLRQIREAMAGAAPVQARLDMCVRIIAGSMVAEVCSIYLRAGNGDLELFATEGLSADAVHVTKLKPGEGLVGEVMRQGRPVNLSDAPAHPAFAYRPETGEDPYHGFLGVPLLRGGRAIGVLVVQNRTERSYGEDEVEDLQIIAMVLAEMVAVGGETAGADQALKNVDLAPHKPDRIKGARLAEGLAYGEAVLHERPVGAKELLSEDAVAEEVRLKKAVLALQTQIDGMMGGEHGLVGESFEVLETYRMFAHDRGWNRSLEEAVRGGLTAEAAVERVRSEHRARLGQARDPYLRERLHDLEDLNDRLLRHLTGNSDKRILPDNAILIARNLGPADLLEYDRKKLRGILLEEGSTASHAAIIARALDIPCVGRLPDLRDKIREGDKVIVDAENGEAYLRPRPDVIKAINARIEVRNQRKAEFAKLRDTPAFTKDGYRVTLLMNAGLDLDLELLREAGAEGIGLFRTEFQFMVAEQMPRFNAQTELYRRVLDAADGMPVTFRTLDLGGDKILPYMEAEREDNPALGWRAIRMGLDRPALLRLQLRALIAAADGRPLRIMFPMIANVDEFKEARAYVDQEVTWAERRGRRAPERLDVGAMIEAPSLIWHLDALLRQVDFVSVGTNDLMQYLFAADRQNPRVADRYDPLSPPALRVLKTIQEACATSGTPVSICGEMAGRPLEAFALVALGFDRLSMPPAGIGPVKRMVLGVDREAARRGILPLLERSAGSVRAEVETLARKLYVSI